MPVKHTHTSKLKLCYRAPNMCLDADSAGIKLVQVFKSAKAIAGPAKSLYRFNTGRCLLCNVYYNVSEHTSNGTFTGLETSTWFSESGFQVEAL